jgi:two-component system sensor histidine kinase CreC
MSIFVRLWLAMATVLLAGAWLTVSLLQDEVRPSVRQALEETLADNANLAAVLVADDLREGRVGAPDFNRRMQSLLERQLKARIWEFDKTAVTQRLYITDAHGTVLYDSNGADTGKDYSRWNDVRRTLKGQYGARSSPSRPGDPESSVMYVAAPVMDGNRIIGVVTLGKAGVTVQPFIDRARDRMLLQGGWVVALTLLVAALAAWWLRQGIHRVAAYARDLGPGREPLRFKAAR